MSAAPLAPTHSHQPQFATGSRLLRLGETVEFRLFLPDGIPPQDLTIFPLYLEQASPGNAFQPGGNLGWLDALPSETLELAFDDGWCSITYTPEKAGS